jgi:5-(carboxyamino)imidazole ribonucleotide synthase
MSKKTTVGILGGGQLGMMLCQASKEIGIETNIYCPDADSPAQLHSNYFTCANYLDKKKITEFNNSVDYITYEFENIPTKTLDYINNKEKLRPGIKSLELTQDRLIEKEFLKKLNIPIAPYIEFKNQDDIEFTKSEFNEGILKTRRFGYDGKGQININKNTSYIESNEDSIIEKKIPFEFEFSQVVCRDIYGNVSHFPFTRNEHENHILKHSYAPLKLDNNLEKQAKEITKNIIEALNHIGVLTVEFFKTKTDILVNEIAPRVHNSGHWTIEGCSTSQFKIHMQAVIGMKIKDPKLLYNCHMENLIGDDIHAWENIQSNSQTHIHLYNKKEVKKGRKMGHLTHILD